MNPTHVKLLHKAQALDRSGKAAEAATAYRAFLRLQPGHASAWADYAGKLLQLNRLEEAQQACDAALRIAPQTLSARINLGCVQMRQGHLNEAEYQFRSVLMVDSHRFDARLCLGECLLNKRDLEKIWDVLTEGIPQGSTNAHYAPLRPRHAELWAIFSTTLYEAQQWEDAEKACRAALAIDPHTFMAQANLGSIRMAQSRFEEAEAFLRRLVADHPQEEAARLLLITCLTRIGDLASASQEISKAIQRNPTSLAVHNSVTGTYYNRGRWAEYRAEVERFRKADPTSAHPDWEQGLVDLLFGNMPQGWERYEARLRLPPESKQQRSFAQPAWSGGSLAGKTLLLWAEQGLGDTLMFLRYLPLVKARGGRVFLEVQSALVEVALTCAGADVVIPKGATLPPFDLQCSLMSLPWVFKTELATIPADIPYLDVPETVPHRQVLLECLNQAKEQTRIGLVWAGRPGYGRDFERSLPAATLAPLAALPDVAWFSLQLGKQDLPPLPNLTSLAPLLENFADTAYVLSGMDLVITVDTAVAHLAGALGIPTLLLLSFQPDFRWLLEREDSPWYPSIRLYRQPDYGDWKSVVARILNDLTQGT